MDSLVASHLAIIESLLLSGKAIEFLNKEGAEAKLVTWKDQHIMRATEVIPAVVEEGIFIPPIRMATGVNLPTKRSDLSFLLGQFAPGNFFLEARAAEDPLMCCRVRSNTMTSLIVLA